MTGVTDHVDRDALLRSARAWMTDDPDPETKNELAKLLDAATGHASNGAERAVAVLRERFAQRLSFGTAGLRGPLGAGPNAMNRVVVGQTAAAIGGYLTEMSDGGVPSVVIGYDGRKNSSVFARDTAEILAGSGVRAILFPQKIPTPVLAFAVRECDAAAGIMVTASHNPASDNGYKVYLGGPDNGAQIIPPIDARIARKIDDIAARFSFSDLPRSNDYEMAGEHVVDAYIALTAAIAPSPPRAQPTIVYTPLHGVGWTIVKRVFEEAGFTSVAIVAAQQEPDETFPTVDFPNPEEPGALDLAYELGRECRADLIIANDPDADRLAVAVPDSNSPDGFRRLGGSEVGALLAWQVMEKNPNKRGSLACSIVSSPVLRPLAEAYGCEFVETLTGFKWISRADDLLFGFEEALGYLVNPEHVRDKDGISAALAIMLLASDLKAESRGLEEHLDAFAERFGFFGSSQVSIRMDSPSLVGAVMASIRRALPTVLGGIRVAEIDDFRSGVGELLPADLLRVRLDDQSRIMIRPSGTEPKLKVYIDVEVRGGSLDERKSRAHDRIERLRQGVVELLEEHSPSQ